MMLCSCGTEFDEAGYCPVCGSAYGICPYDGACQGRINENCKSCHAGGACDDDDPEDYPTRAATADQT